MSSRLAFQTQLASIMEVLANAAVAEICKLVDDDYAVVSLQMSQCQRENKGLKRKLNLLELKMARGYAERRLRESAMNSRPNSRVHINTNEKFRGSSSSTGGVYDIQLDPMGMWSGGPGANNDHNSSQMHPNPIRGKSPDLQLVEPESLLVKEERMEDPLGDAEADDVPLIGEDGLVECGPRGGSGRTGPGDTTSHPPASAHGPEQVSQPQHPEQQQQGPRNRHRVESAAVEDRDPDILLIKVEDLDPRGGGLSIQEGPEESSRDDYRGGALPLEATHHNSPPAHTHHHPGTTRHHTTEPADPESTPSTLRLGQNLGSITATGGPDLAAECTGESSRPTLPAPTSQKCIGTTSPAASLGNKANMPKGAPDNTTPTQTTQQLSKQRAANTLGSEYSMFELETFFTRWAPDTSTSTSPSGGPSCSYTDDTTDTDPDCLIVDPEPQPQLPSATVRPTGEGVPFSGHQGVQAATLGVGGGIQGHPTWSRAAILRASQQAHQRQLQRRLRAQQLQQTHLENPTTSTTNSTSTGMSSQSLHSLVGLPPGRGATAKGFAHIEVTLAGQQAAQLAQQHCDAAGRRKSYVCRACGKAFTGQSNLEAHQRVHTGEKPFRCATCGKMFSEAGNLKKHQRVHTGEKPFACSHCGKRFAWICNLKTHQQSVCGDGGGGV
nr:Krueppel-like factor luna isoform X1 [Oncorhynchus nerka]